MENIVNTLITCARGWLGYLEKKSNSQLDDFTANAGSGNYTCFARDYKRDTGLNLQAQPWCAMFVSEIFVQVFGLEIAKKLLGGALYHYCPTGVEQFKKAGRWSTVPEPGAVIFFTNGARAYHTGIVVEVSAFRIKTVEGNTSGASGVIENGGGVCEKSYSRTYGKILGYGLPDWSLVEPVKKSGWHEEEGGWRYYHGDTGEPIRNDWHEEENGAWYWFDGAGHMVRNAWKQSADGHWYYLGADGCMVTDCLLGVGDEVYAFATGGEMLEGEYIVRTNERGALELVREN